LTSFRVLHLDELRHAQDLLGGVGDRGSRWPGRRIGQTMTEHVRDLEVLRDHRVLDRGELVQYPIARRHLGLLSPQG